MTEAISICFDCANGYVSKCDKIRKGVPIEGSTIKQTGGGYFRVVSCPLFERDCITGRPKIAKALGIKTLNKDNIKEVAEIARRKGFLLIVERTAEGKHTYYLRRRGE